MRGVLLASIMVLAPAWAQIRVPASPAPARAAETAAPATVPSTVLPQRATVREVFATLGKKFDGDLQEIGGRDVQLLGGTRGIYLAGYGAVYTTELSLAYPPARTPFHAVITPQEIKGLHDRKVKHLPLVRDAMRTMMVDSAKSLTAVPMNEQIVLSVRLLYLPYEDIAGLPAEIRMTADRQSAIDGNIQTEEQ